MLEKHEVPAVRETLSCSLSMRFSVSFVLRTQFRYSISANGFKSEEINHAICPTSHTSYISFMFIVVPLKNVGIYFLL